MYNSTNFNAETHINSRCCPTLSVSKFAIGYETLYKSIIQQQEFLFYWNNKEIPFNSFNTIPRMFYFVIIFRFTYL